MQSYGAVYRLHNAKKIEDAAYIYKKKTVKLTVCVNKP